MWLIICSILEMQTLSQHEQGIPYDCMMQLPRDEIDMFVQYLFFMSIFRRNNK